MRDLVVREGKIFMESKLEPKLNKKPAHTRMPLFCIETALKHIKISIHWSREVHVSRSQKKSNPLEQF